MTEDHFPSEFDPTRCVLFLGAGFSWGAQNGFGKHPPVGRELELALKELSEIDPSDDSQLIDIAEYALSQKRDVYGLLERSYTIKRPSEDQKKILDLPWLRIYTTNYDNCVSVCRGIKGLDPTCDVYDVTDPVPRKLNSGALIHLHGSIIKCDPEHVDKSLVLSRRSYVEQRAISSPWWDWFEKDARVAQFIFFLGYDLNDFEPAKYLIRIPEVVEKRHFILRAPSGAVAERKLQRYGIRHSFELAGFVERLSRAKVLLKPAHDNQLSSFVFVDLEKDKKLPAKPTSAEVSELLVFGKLRFGALVATLPSSTYTVYRENKINEAVKRLEECKTLVLHSKVGNGKSVFADQLKISLSKNGKKCFTLRSGVVPLSQDIEYLSASDDVVIFFPTYDSAFSNIHLFSSLRDSARFVVEISSSTLSVRFREVHTSLIYPISRLGLDKLGKTDIQSLVGLLGGAGLSKLSRRPEVCDGLEFREFLIISFEDPEISNRIKRALDPLLVNSDLRKILCVISLIKAAGLNVSPNFLESAYGHDPYARLSESSESALEVMEFGIDSIDMHSSILSSHVISKMIPRDELFDCIFKICYVAAKRLDEEEDFLSDRFREARAVLSSLIRFGFIQNICGKDFNFRKEVGALYERCRDSNLISKEPLFWLQYSIYWQDQNRLDLAESHMEEAYVRGSDRPGFKTFQLDTNYLGLICEIEARELDRPNVRRFEKLLELVRVCSSMIDDGNHRQHVLKEFFGIETMLGVRSKNLTEAEAFALAIELGLAVQRLDSLSAEDKAIWGSEPCKQSLERCCGILANRG